MAPARGKVLVKTDIQVYLLSVLFNGTGSGSEILCPARAWFSPHGDLESGSEAWLKVSTRIHNIVLVASAFTGNFRSGRQRALDPDPQRRLLAVRLSTVHVYNCFVEDGSKLNFHRPSFRILRRDIIRPISASLTAKSLTLPICTDLRAEWDLRPGSAPLWPCLEEPHRHRGRCGGRGLQGQRGSVFRII